MNQEDWGELERAAGATMPSYHQQQSGLDLWLSLRGRISRSTYWLWFALPIFGIQMFGTMADYLVLHRTPPQFGPLRMLAALVTFWPGIVASVKRLHDLGHPGWYLAIFYGGTFGAGVALAIAVPLWGAAGAIVGLPLIILGLGAFWYSIKMMFFRGTVGPNEFGPDTVT